MYDTSEAAMEANEAIDFDRAGRELQNHGIRWARPIDVPEVARPKLNDSHILVWAVSSDRAGETVEQWECIRRTTRAILEWLGY